MKLWLTCGFSLAGAEKSDLVVLARDSLLLFRIFTDAPVEWATHFRLAGRGEGRGARWILTYYRLSMKKVDGEHEFTAIVFGRLWVWTNTYHHRLSIHSADVNSQWFVTYPVHEVIGRGEQLIIQSLTAEILRYPFGPTKLLISWMGREWEYWWWVFKGGRGGELLVI